MIDESFELGQQQEDGLRRFEAVSSGALIDCGCPYCYCPNQVQGIDYCDTCIYEEHPAKFQKMMFELRKAAQQAPYDDY